jgi:hypothetical protein
MYFYLFMDNCNDWALQPRKSYDAHGIIIRFYFKEINTYKN